jgi:DNA-binding beta-propeller fold protein YncE
VIASADDVLSQFVTALALAAAASGNLYVAVYDPHTELEHGQILKRDRKGNWSGIAGLADAFVSALAVDAADNLYVADGAGDNSRIEKRDAQDNKSEIATFGDDLGEVNLDWSSGLAVDATGNLYVAGSGKKRVLKYTPGP